MIKNIVILFYPPLRGNTFPVHMIEDLKGYHFFILISQSDYEQHKKFFGLTYIKIITVITFEIATLIKLCDEITKTYGTISNFVYLAEECVRLCGMLRHHYGMSADNLDRFIDKNLMLKKLQHAGVRVPQGILFDDTKYQQNQEKYLQEIENTLKTYPFFIKPRNLCGSVGTALITKRDELRNFAEKKTNHDYLIQEYIDGTLFHCESFIKNYQVLYVSVFEYSKPGFFFSKGYPVGSISLPENDLLAKRIRQFSDNALKKFGVIANGIVHMEIFLNQSNELLFLEVAARPPGLVGDLLYQKHLGISIDKAHLLLQLGEYKNERSKLEINHYAARYIFPFPKTGRITKFLNPIKINSAFIENFMPHVHDEVKKSNDLFNVAGTMILWNKDYAALRQDFLALKNHIPFEIQEVDTV